MQCHRERWYHGEAGEELSIARRDTAMTRSTVMPAPTSIGYPGAKTMDVFQEASVLGFGDIHMKVDADCGLHAIIAIHSTRLGPALGGCRCIPYVSTEAALLDAMRLARGMTYKAAISGLPQGGGKAVLIRPPEIREREAYFESFGRFVDSLGGRYITAVDSGTGPADMDVIARRTRHVACTSASKAGSGDPSPHTALGVRRGIEAAVRFAFGRETLEGVHIAVQGLGHVGYALARELHAFGARLTVCDVNEAVVRRSIDEFGAKVVAPERIYEVSCDVFAPCALGGVIDDRTLPRIAARIVAGAANNQLAELRHGDRLHERGILYAPDYVINAGGIMQIALRDEAILQAKLLGIYDTLTEIFRCSAREAVPPQRVADGMVEDILRAA